MFSHQFGLQGETVSKKERKNREERGKRKRQKRKREKRKREDKKREKEEEKGEKMLDTEVHICKLSTQRFR